MITLMVLVMMKMMALIMIMSLMMMMIIYLSWEEFMSRTCRVLGTGVLAVCSPGDHFTVCNYHHYHYVDHF